MEDHLLSRSGAAMFRSEGWTALVNTHKHGQGDEKEGSDRKMAYF